MSNKEPVKHWRYYLPSENGEGYAIIFIDSTGVFSAVSDFGNYGYIWGHTGNRSIKEFLLESEKDWHYFANKLDPKEITDWDATETRIEEHIREYRKEGNYTKEFADRELQLLHDSAISDEWSFYNWYQDTNIHDAAGLMVQRTSYQVEHFVKKTMKRLCGILQKELADESAGGPPVLPALAPKQHCKKHPKYRAIRSPRAYCVKCWEFYLYKSNHGEPSAT